MSDTTTTAGPDTTRNYEGLFLFGTAATANVDGAMDTVRGFIEKHGGSPLVLKKWDDRKLAYEIAKQTRGLYVLSLFTAPPSAVLAIDREVRLSDTVLRCLITDAAHLSAAEFEAMQPQKPEPRNTAPVMSADDEGRSGGGGFRGGARRDDEPSFGGGGDDE